MTKNTIVAEELLAEITRVANGARLANYDGHVYFDSEAHSNKSGKASSATGRIVPAGEGPIISFALAVTV